MIVLWSVEVSRKYYSRWKPLDLSVWCWLSALIIRVGHRASGSQSHLSMEGRHKIHKYIECDYIEYKLMLDLQKVKQPMWVVMGKRRRRNSNCGMRCRSALAHRRARTTGSFEPYTIGLVDYARQSVLKSNAFKSSSDLLISLSLLSQLQDCDTDTRGRWPDTLSISRTTSLKGSSQSIQTSFPDVGSVQGWAHSRRNESSLIDLCRTARCSTRLSPWWHTIHEQVSFFTPRFSHSITDPLQMHKA